MAPSNLALNTSRDPQPLWAAVPAPHHSPSKELPLTSNPNLPSLNLKPAPLALLLSTLSKEFSFSRTKVELYDYNHFKFKLPGYSQGAVTIP